MGRKNLNNRKINPIYWIFCEGETEESFISYLRSKYRLSVKIISKIAGNSINSRFIANCKKGKVTHKKDMDFLLYDTDNIVILDKLKKIKAKILFSNPCIELWFLLHYKDQISFISSEDCLQELKKRNKTYNKGAIDNNLKEVFDNKIKDACNRAKKLTLYKNPSSNIFEFIEMLEVVKNN